METTTMNIAFSGPSGTGKTTLCKHLQSEGYNWQSTSAWDVLNNLEKNVLADKFGYTRSGHKNVIQLSGSNPEFAITFQTMIKNARHRQLARAKGDSTIFPGIVIDRSPLDNLVYMYTQASMYMGSVAMQEFIDTAIHTINNYLDVVFYIPVTIDQERVEDNKSRITNLHYQKFISGVFDWVILTYGHRITTPIIPITVRDLESRKREIERHLKHLSHG